jgi:hypothetical protein
VLLSSSLLLLSSAVVVVVGGVCAFVGDERMKRHSKMRRFFGKKMKQLRFSNFVFPVHGHFIFFGAHEPGNEQSWQAEKRSFWVMGCFVFPNHDFHLKTA